MKTTLASLCLLSAVCAANIALVFSERTNRAYIVNATSKKTTCDLASSSSSSDSSSEDVSSSYSQSSSISSSSSSSSSRAQNRHHVVESVDCELDESGGPSDGLETVCFCDVESTGSSYSEENIPVHSSKTHGTDTTKHPKVHLSQHHVPAPSPVRSKATPVHQYPGGVHSTVYPSRFILPHDSAPPSPSTMNATVYPAHIATAPRNRYQPQQTRDLQENRTGVHTLRFSRDGNQVRGGDVAEIRQHPYQAQLILDGRFWCGAAIISNAWVVTAAHCLYKEPQVSRMVRAGTSFRNQGGSVHRLSEAISHWLFNHAESFDYDIALLKVRDLFQFGQNLQPIALATIFPKDSYAESAVVSGWGELIGGSRTGSESLQHSQVQLLPMSVCQEAYSPSHVTITAHSICASAPEGEAAFYQGDSGGPLASLDKLIGVASFGPVESTDNKLPGVYTSVAEVREWIRGISGV